MKALELIMGDNKTAIPIDKISSSVILDEADGSFYMRSMGTDFENNTSYTWFHSQVKMGDELSISVKEVDNIFQPIKTGEAYSFSDEEEQMQNERILQRFRLLEEILDIK